MRNESPPHTAKRFAVCLAFILGALIFQGCGEDEPKPYADLDERFPEGRPGITGVAERAQDAEYLAQVRSGAAEFVQLSQAAASARSAAEHFKEQLVKGLEKRLGHEPSLGVVADTLAKNDHYQQLLKAQQEAEAAMEAKRLANVALIRARMSAERDAYDALRAEADARAKAAGLPTRAEEEAQKAAPKRPESPMNAPAGGQQ